MLPRTASAIDDFLRARGLAPLARFGQNFLVHAPSVEAVAEAAEPLADRIVLEVGPGLGALTERLLERGARVIAAEVDTAYCALLREEFGTRLHLIEGDCLDGPQLAPALCAALESAGAFEQGWRVVSNLPYQISSPFLAALPRLPRLPECLVLMLQREVAQVLRAAPGSQDYTPLSFLAGLCFEVELLRRLPAGHFHPQPQVESALVRMRPVNGGAPVQDLQSLLSFARALLGARRQVLRRTLRRAAEGAGVCMDSAAVAALLADAGLLGSERADELPIAKVVQLHSALRSVGGL